MVGAALTLVLTASQIQWANVALRLGEPYGLGYTLAAMEGQESSYCKFKVNGWSRGCLGTKRSTVRTLYDPNATRTRLESDNAYAIRAGLAVLHYCQGNTKTWRAMLLCYHYGEPAEKFMVAHQTPYDPDDYIGAITKRLKELQQIPVDTK